MTDITLFLFKASCKVRVDLSHLLNVFVRELEMALSALKVTAWLQLLIE